MFFRYFAIGFFFLFFSAAQLSAQPGNQKPLGATSKDLLGLWAGESEVIEFRNDGKCRYGGELFDYQLSNGHLVIHTLPGKVTFAFVVKSDKLTLTAEGQQSFYTRMTSPEQVKPQHRDLLNPIDLTGKWCFLKNSAGAYSQRCITLRHDGTYLYVYDVPRANLSGALVSADSGTWYVDRNRLYYQSTARGNGSYKLERRNQPGSSENPMIVLDDEPFVTTGKLR